MKRNKYRLVAKYRINPRGKKNYPAWEKNRKLRNISDTSSYLKKGKYAYSCGVPGE